MSYLRVCNVFSGKIHDTPDQFMKNCKHILEGSLFDELCKDLLPKINEAEESPFARPQLFAIAADGVENDGKPYKLILGEREDIMKLYYAEKDKIQSSKWCVVPKKSEVEISGEKKLRKRIPYIKK